MAVSIKFELLEIYPQGIFYKNTHLIFTNKLSFILNII
jgi:hypothetical protein